MAHAPTVILDSLLLRRVLRNANSVILVRTQCQRGLLSVNRVLRVPNKTCVGSLHAKLVQKGNTKV